MENLKHKFKVSQKVEEARKLIENGHLLEAHKVLTDLETSRDGLLYEQHKLEKHNKDDIKQIQLLFADVECLSKDLGQVLWAILRRTITLVQKDSVKIVSAMSIVEKEHSADMKIAEQKKASGFLPLLRPKNWRQHAMETLKQAVEDRIESDMYESRENDKMWLVRHLEILRKYCVEDLLVVKSQCSPCFPHAYNIFEQYVHWYHLALSRHLQNLIRDGIEGNEIISLLTWLNQYIGKDFMGHPKLALDVSRLPSLLDDSINETLMNNYFSTTKKNVLEWTQKSLQQDKADWGKKKKPEMDASGHYRTSLPIILFQMVQQTLEAAEKISNTLKNQVFEICIKEMNKFVHSYEEAITLYKEEHFRNREEPPFYSQFMVAVANNCEIFIEAALNLQLEMDINSLKEVYQSETEFFELEEDENRNLLMKSDVDPLLKFRHEINHVAQVACGFLLDEVFLDLKSQYDTLFQKSWLYEVSSSAADTICFTLEDYYSDYVHLKVRYLAWIMHEAERRVVIDYLKAVLGRRIKLSNNAERMKAGEKLLKEQQQLRVLFNKLSPSSVRSPCDVLIPIAEVLKLQDKSMIWLELSSLVSKYQDATSEQMQALLAIRGDFSASEARKLAKDSVKAITSSKVRRQLKVPTLYSSVPVSSTGAMGKLKKAVPNTSHISKTASMFFSKFSRK